MLKMLLKRLWKQRRINKWLFAELMVVFVLLAALTDALYMIVKPMTEPIGLDVKDVYYLHPEYDPEYFPEDIPEEETGRVRYNSIREILKRVEQHADVECATLFYGATPYISERIESFYIDSLKKYSIRTCYSDKNFFRVFNIHLTDGVLDNREMGSYPRSAIVTRMLADSLPGKSVCDYYSPEKSYEITGVVPDIKMAPVARYGFVAFLPLEEQVLSTSVPNIALRVKEGAREHFKLHFQDDMKQMKAIGPYSLNEVVSYKAIEAGYIYDSTWRLLKMGVLFILFLLVNVFLGIVGSFCFRTLARREEIGIKKAVGAPSGAILKELLLEGFLLMLLASLPALIVCANLIWFELPITDVTDLTTVRIITDLLIPYIILLVMVFLGIWFPARKAVRLVPADAL